jgi:FixJ family two-component response regulator
MTSERRLVCVVDDDESVRESLPDLVKQLGYDVRTFASAVEFLASDDVEAADCLILDVNMPKMSGPDLQRVLKARERNIPTIFITARGSAKDGLRRAKLDAAAFLIKPFSYAELRQALNTVFAD